MKTFIYSLLLSTIFITHVYAETDENATVEDEHGIRIQIDMDDDEESNDNSSEQELENKIKRKVLSIFSDIIDAADEELTEDEKKAAENKIEEKIEQAIEEISEIADEHDSDSDISIGGVNRSLEFVEAGLGAMAIFFIFGTPIMIIAAVLYSSYRKKRLMHDTINQYVSSGKDIPDEVLKGLQKEVAPKNNLHRGLVMSGIGLGIFACFAVIGSLEAAALGLIPLFIGLAQLLIWKLESK